MQCRLAYKSCTMKDTLTYEIEVDEEPIIVELPVNGNGVIELDYTHLTLEDDEEDPERFEGGDEPYGNDITDGSDADEDDGKDFDEGIDF